MMRLDCICANQFFRTCDHTQVARDYTNKQEKGPNPIPFIYIKKLKVPFIQILAW